MQMKEIGPIQVLAVAFGPAVGFEGRILAELERLEGDGTLRVLDLLFVHKDRESGDLLALDVQGENLGAIVGALLGFEFDGDGEGNGGDAAPARVAEGAFGFTKAELVELAASLQSGSAGAVVLLEHLWARNLRRVIREAGGVPIGEGFLTPQALAEVAAELTAVSTAMDEEHAAAPTA